MTALNRGLSSADPERGQSTPQAIVTHVARVLESGPFARAPRMRRFLRFLVDETLAGRAARLKEYTIGTAVFDKPDDFDPLTSAVVRVEAGRLRRLLSQYEQEFGRNDALRVQIPKGSYVPVFTARRAVVDSSITEPAPIEDRGGAAPLWPQERRLVTVLSCGLADESAQYALEGDLLDLLEQIHERCATIGLAHGADVDASSSDRLMVYFGWPTALEDAACRALGAALEMVATAQSTSAQRLIALRIGVATSEVIARGPRSPDAQFRASVIGAAPALANRLQLNAPPNAIIVAESTRRLTGTEFQFLASGELAGGDGGGMIWRVVGDRPAATRFRARHRGVQGEIVGRQEERALIFSRWRLCVAREGQGILLLGEAGIGKSRLAESILEDARREGLRLRAQCSPHHTNSALFPMVDLLRSRLGLWRSRQGLDVTITRMLERLKLDDDIDRALLTELLTGDDTGRAAGLLASRRKGLTLKLLIRVALALAEIQPVILLVEDVHWADPTTLELLQELIDASANTRLLLILTSRPEGAPQFARQTNLTAIRLARLPRENCSELIGRVTGVMELSDFSRGLIVDKAAGVPLFLEELTKHFLAQQTLDPSTATVPESLNDLLAVQLDRLGPVRGVAQIASVLGRHIPREVLVLAAGREVAELDAALDQLLAAGIFVRVQASEVFAFRHALLREAAYHSLLDPARRELHRRIGNIFVDSFPGVAAEYPEVIAHHLLEGGCAERSIQYWIDAGRMAAGRYALAEATAHLRTALTALELIPEIDRQERELALLLELGLVIRSACGYGDEQLRTIYERAQRLAEALNRPAQQLDVVYGLWTHAAGRGDWRRALRLAHQFEERSVQLRSDDQLEVEAHRLLGGSYAFIGDFRASKEHHERAFALYDPARHGPRLGFDPGVTAAAYLSWTLWHLGETAEARRFASKALAAAEAKRHPPTLAMAYSWLTFHAVCDDNFEAVKQYDASLRLLCDEQECRYWQPLVAACAEWAAFQQDRDPNRLKRLAANEVAFEERYLNSCLLVLGARICHSLEMPAQGLEFVERALSFVEEHDERVWEAEALRVKAELLLQWRPVDSDEAERLLSKAAEVARLQGAIQIERRVLETASRLATHLPQARAARAHGKTARKTSAFRA
jgi:class 3 adenylate cyclase